MTHLTFRQLFTSLFTLFAILFGASLLFAWSGPTATPPSGNVAAPINVGTEDQVKDAGLGVNSLAVFGNTLLQAASYLNFGSTSGYSGYGFRDNNGVMEYKNSSGEWTSFDSLGGSSSSETTLSGGAHTSTECETAGGTVRSIGGGDYACEFSGSSCVSGWTKLSSWSSTQLNSCSSGGGNCGTGCTTGSHAWADTATETCTYTAGDANYDPEHGDGICHVWQSYTCSATVLTVGCY